MAQIPGIDLEFSDGVEAVGYRVRSTSLLRTSTRETNDPPTLGDIQAAFGFASEAGAGFVGTLSPDGAGTSLYLCACDGTNWWTTPMTLAT